MDTSQVIMFIATVYFTIFFTIFAWLDSRQQRRLEKIEKEMRDFYLKFGYEY